MKRIFILLLATIMVTFSLPTTNTNGKVFAEEGESNYTDEEWAQEFEDHLEEMWTADGHDAGLHMKFSTSTGIDPKTGLYDITFWVTLQTTESDFFNENFTFMGLFSNFEIALHTENPITTETQIEYDTALEGNITAKTIDSKGSTSGYAIVYNGNKNFRFKEENTYSVNISGEGYELEEAYGANSADITVTVPVTVTYTTFTTKILTLHTKSNSVKLSDMSAKVGYTTKKTAKEIPGERILTSVSTFLPGDFDHDGQFTVKDLIAAQYYLADSIGREKAAHDEDMALYYDSISLQSLKLYLIEELNISEMINNLTQRNQDIMIDLGLVLPPCTHTDTEWHILEEPTCSESGFRIQKCSSCGKFIAGTLEAIDPIHTPGEWITNEETGWKSLYCTVCCELIRSERIYK